MAHLRGLTLRSGLMVLLSLVQSITAATTNTTTTNNPPFDAYVVNGNRPNNLTVAINVPANSSDDLYFHFQAPSGQQWSAFGFGDQMAGALMFVVYAKTDNYDIMVSPRLATGHQVPQYTDAVQVETLAGTQIVDGNFLVNARCVGCRKWNGGSIDVTSSSQSMMWAVGPGDGSLQSDDNNVRIPQHDNSYMGTFTMDLLKATGDAGVPNVLGMTATDSTDQGDNGTQEDANHLVVVVHAILLIIAFVFIFPLGYLLLRLFERVWVHMVVQTLGVIFVVAGAAVGIAISQTRHISPKLNTPHQGLGLTVFLMTILAWSVGLVGHLLFKKNGVPTMATIVHRCVGPLTVLLALVNVGLGFSFSDNHRRILPFYLVVLIIFTVIGGFVYMINRRKMRQRAMQTPAAQNFNEAMYVQGQGQGQGVAQQPPSYEAGHGRPENVPIPMQMLPPQSVVHSNPEGKI